MERRLGTAKAWNFEWSFAIFSLRMEELKLREEGIQLEKTGKTVRNIQKSALFELYCGRIEALGNLSEKASICAEKLLPEKQKLQNIRVDLQKYPFFCEVRKE